MSGSSAGSAGTRREATGTVERGILKFFYAPLVSERIMLLSNVSFSSIIISIYQKYFEEDHHESQSAGCLGEYKKLP